MEKKEAMKILKDFYNKSALFSVRTALDTIIPELKESEDEEIKKILIQYFENFTLDTFADLDPKKILAWLEKQCTKTMDCSQNHQDSNHPNGCIVLEDFNGGEGFYKVHLDYLSKKQIEEVEEMVRMWNHEESKTPNGVIKNCIGMCLTDVDEQRFTDYNTSLKECLAWLEKQGEQKSAEEYNITGISSKNAQGKLGEMIKNLKPVNEVLEQKSVDTPKFKVGDWVVTSYGMVNQVIAVDEDDDGFTLDDDTYLSGSWKDNFHLWTIQDAKDGDVLACKINKAEIGGDIEKLPNITPTIYIYQNVVKDKDYIHAYCSLYNESSLVPSNSMYYNTFVYNAHPATKEQRDLLFQKMKEAGYEWNAEHKQLKKIESKSAWSEEDEINYNYALAACKCYGEAKGYADTETHQKTNNWLKSLRPHNTWKPSDEQMERLNGVINSLPHQEVLYSLYQDLKKLKG